MNKIYTKFKIGVMAVAIAAVVAIPSANAQTSGTSMSALLERLQTLMAQVQELQDRLAEVRQMQGQLREEIRTEFQDYIKDGLREGMTDEDIKQIQEILATDPTIYPEGITSGYFGPLTRQALARFQSKFDLEVTGEIDDETQAALEALLEERFGEGRIPPGLLTAPGIRKKFEMRLEAGCDNSGPGKAPFCKKIKTKYKFEDDDGDHEDDELEIEVETHNGVTHVHVEYADGTEESFFLGDVSIEDEAAVIAGIVEKTGLTEEEVEAVVKFDEEDEHEDDHDDELEIEVEIEDGEAKVKIEFADGSEDEFVVESTDEDEIIAAIVAETDLTEDEVREVIEFEYKDDDDEDDHDEDDHDDDHNDEDDN